MLDSNKYIFFLFLAPKIVEHFKDEVENLVLKYVNNKNTIFNRIYLKTKLNTLS